MLFVLKVILGVIQCNCLQLDIKKHLCNIYKSSSYCCCQAEWQDPWTSCLFHNKLHNFQGNTHIEHLDLEDNCIGEQGALHLADMLRENCYITTLVIYVYHNSSGSLKDDTFLPGVSNREMYYPVTWNRFASFSRPPEFNKYLSDI